MEQEEILKLLSSLKIDEEEDHGVGMLGGDLCTMGERKLNSWLVYKVLSLKAIPRDLFCN